MFLSLPGMPFPYSFLLRKILISLNSAREPLLIPTPPYVSLHFLQQLIGNWLHFLPALFVYELQEDRIVYLLPCPQAPAWYPAHSLCFVC